MVLPYLTTIKNEVKSQFLGKKYININGLGRRIYFTQSINAWQAPKFNKL